MIFFFFCREFVIALQSTKFEALAKAELGAQGLYPSWTRPVFRPDLTESNVSRSTVFAMTQTLNHRMVECLYWLVVAGKGLRPQSAGVLHAQVRPVLVALNTGLAQARFRIAISRIYAPLGPVLTRKLGLVRVLAFEQTWDRTAFYYTGQLLYGK